MKHCNTCDTTKQDCDFHKRTASVDGLAARCKSCQREYDKNRAKLPHRVLARENYAKSERGRIASNRAKAAYVKRNKIKNKTHNITSNAIRDGKIKRIPCEVCGKTKVHAHHPDYSKPLDVMWLCAAHHKEWHLKNGEGLNG